MAGIILWVVIGLLALVLLAGSVFMFCFVILRPRPKRGQKPRPDAAAHKSAPPAHGSFQEKQQGQLRAKAWLRAQTALEEVEIRSGDGLRLHGYFLPAPQPTNKIVLAVHGYKCDGLKEWGLYADYYHRRGYHLLMPDNRAHGKSEGRYIGFGWLDRLDVLRWTEYLCGRFGPGCEILLHGISMGSATVLMAGGEAALCPQVKGIVADCGYTSAWDEFTYQMGRNFHLPPFPFLYGADLLCRWLAGYGFREADTLAQVKKIRVPVLFIHGDADTYVPTEMGYRLYEACTAPKRLMIARGAIHANSYLTDPAAYEAAVSAFADSLNF